MRELSILGSSPVASTAGASFERAVTSTLTAEGVRTQLHRIVNSADFDATERSRRFLGYVVEEEIAGRADRIKAYAIATEVFGRDASFDAHSDPVVRIEAGHLRRALNLYYVTAGISDEIVISIPKGSYVPKFDMRPSPMRPVRVASPARRWRAVPIAAACLLALATLSWPTVNRIRSDRQQAPALPRLLVRPFDDLTNTGNSQAIARGLTQEIIGQIAKFKDIVTVAGDPRDDQGASAARSSASDPRYVLAGDINVTDNEFRLRARVLNRVDNTVIWANSYTGDLQASKLIETVTDIARQVVTP